MREISSQIGDVSSPDGAYQSARDIAGRVVDLGKVEYGTKGCAIDRISREFKLGSFLKKVFAGEPATVHLHLYVRLCGALEAMNERQKARINHNEMILEQLRVRDAASQGAPSVGRGGRKGSLAAF